MLNLARPGLRAAFARRAADPSRPLLPGGAAPPKNFDCNREPNCATGRRSLCAPSERRAQGFPQQVLQALVHVPGSSGAGGAVAERGRGPRAQGLPVNGAMTRHRHTSRRSRSAAGQLPHAERLVLKGALRTSSLQGSWKLTLVRKYCRSCPRAAEWAPRVQRGLHLPCVCSRCMLKGCVRTGPWPSPCCSWACSMACSCSTVMIPGCMLFMLLTSKCFTCKLISA